MEMVGFFVVCYFLRDVLNSVFVCDANIILHDISKHTAFLNCPTDFIQLMNKMKNVPVLKTLADYALFQKYPKDSKEIFPL